LGTDTRTLTYDGEGRITAYTQNAISNNSGFGYDALDRLTSSSGVNKRIYDYDANSNRTDITVGNAFYIYNSDTLSNRLTTVAGPVAKSYSYDASGNTLSDSVSSFVWNANGRLSQITKGTIIYNYQHNALGERISKRGSTLFNGPWRFIYDSAGHLIGEYDKSNQPLQETVWLDDLPIAVIKKDAVTNQPVVYYVHADHLNTPRVILNSSNTVVWRWNGDAFGVGLANQDPDGDGVSFNFNPRFAGQYYDAESGLHYNYQRTYDPATGRYLQSDPIGLSGGINTYGYVGGNPLSRIDPYGTNALTGAEIGTTVCGLHCGIVGAVIGGVVGAVIGGEISDYVNKPKDCNDDNCDTPLSKNDIERLKKFLGGSEALHKEKEGFGGPPKYFDFYKCRNGDIVIKRKGGGSIISNTGLNINAI
jgi:RHS repeat-associated protein